MLMSNFTVVTGTSVARGALRTCSCVLASLLAFGGIQAQDTAVDAGEAYKPNIFEIFVGATIKCLEVVVEVENVHFNALVKNRA